MNSKKTLIVGILAFAVLLILNYIEVKFDSISLVLSCSKALLCGMLLYLMLSFSKITDKKQDNKPFSPGIFAVFTLFSAYRFIYFYTCNIKMVPFFFVLIFIATYAGLFFIIFQFLKLIFKDKNDALVLSLIFMGLLSINIDNPAYLPSYFGGALLLCIVVLALFNRAKIVEFLKPFSAALLVICILNGGYNMLNGVFVSVKLFKANDEFEITKAPERDIYIILLDEYGGKRGLQRIGYDNSEFIGALKKRGFKVAENFESNYSRTAVSIPSFLNLDYIQNLAFETPKEAVCNSKLFKIAKQAGYKIFYMNSWPMEIDVKNGTFIDEAYSMDVSYNLNIVNLFIEKTVFGPLAKYYAENRSADFNDVFVIMDKMVKKNTKKLVFAHFLMPHDPYLLDENGNPKKTNITNTVDRRDGYGKIVLNEAGYISFLKFTNKKVLEILDKIDSESKTEPIIVISGDHGLRPVRYDEKQDMDTAKENYKYYFNTFLAYYNPDFKQEDVKEKSLVNFYINFANDNFGTNFKNKEDEHYYVIPFFKSFSKMEAIQAEY